MITSTELENLMAYATGTENYYRYNCGNEILITDGVKIFAENAEAFWFLNDFCIFMPKWIKKTEEEFFSIKLIVKNGKGDMIISDGNDKPLYKKHYSYTDCPDGEWLFFYDNYPKVLMWHNEY